MCYLQVKRTVNKEREVKIRPINKLNTKNVVSVPHGPHGGMELREKTVTGVKKKCCSELYFFPVLSQSICMYKVDVKSR